MLTSSLEADWWRQAVVYQIYPRSFADANGDGIGDLKGITSRVDYLSELGVDAVWLSPFYPSALKDGGYDVADYRNVDPRIGTLDDFDEMMAALNKAGIKVIVDIVPNHTSNDHEWFKEALAAGKGSAARERYIFMDGKGPNKDQPPTDWESVFGGPAWSPSGQNDGQWYYHWFDSSQPDFNWNNEDVKADFLKTFRFWGDRGVSGFRIDVAHGCAKDMSGELPSYKELAEMTAKKLSNGNADLIHPIYDRDEVQDIYKTWRKIFNEYSPPLIAVAECWVAADRKHLYASPDTLGQAFSFDILLDQFDAAAYRKTIDFQLEGLKESGSSSTWVLSNHDVIRHATRYSLDMPVAESSDLQAHIPIYNMHLASGFTQPKTDPARGLRCARAATMMILGLPGSTYLYQGEELGLPEVANIPAAERQDPNFFRTEGRIIGRDGCRVPLPWNEKGIHHGFGEGKEPHLPMPEWWGKHAVDTALDRPDSTLNLYRRAMALRKDLQCGEALEWLDSPAEVLHYRRPNGWEVVLNAGESDYIIPEGRTVVLSSGVAVTDRVPPETTVWLTPSPSV
ncbi:putative alpha-glucosidase [Kockovaella imperatae]|uniref:Putative alpha-glucosidase n=1 Tax=Kockovaella imperatae TaxID=4999 RepID=A0A1Y1U9X9_9TREE|nr:putative alpha-glucosidase [Kockovaella imperatae]ORX34851.1 putative alpha-glucosidase [Kockovaella imperatae]